MLYQAGKQEFDLITSAMEITSPNFHWQNFDYLFNHIAKNINTVAFEILPKEEQASLGVYLVNNVLTSWEMNNGYHTRQQAMDETKEILCNENSITDLLEMSVIEELDFSTLDGDYNEDFFDAYTPSELSEEELALVKFNEKEIYNQMREGDDNFFYMLEIHDDAFVREDDFCAVDTDYSNQGYLIDSAYEVIPQKMEDKDFLRTVLSEDIDNIIRIAEHNNEYQELVDFVQERDEGLKKVVESYLLAKELQQSLFNKTEQKKKRTVKL